MTLKDAAVKAIIKRIRTINLPNRIRTEGTLSGSYTSTFKGQGLAFDSLRPYAFGDDVRSIDWNATAKWNKPVVKIFHEERDLTVLLVMDISGSAACGSGITKRQFATEVGASLAFSALKNHDRVGLCLFSDQIETFIPPKKTPSQLDTIIRTALFFKPQHTRTHLTASLQALAHLLKKRSILCLLSDFLPTEKSEGDSLFKALRRLKQKHGLICIRIEDPREQILPQVGFVALQDAETQQQLYFDTASLAHRTAYAAQQKAHWRQFEKDSKRQGIHLLTLTNGQPYATALSQFIQHKCA